MKLTKKHKQLIIDGHAAACSEWKQKIEEGFPKLFETQKLKVGEWWTKVWRDGDIDLFRISEIKNGVYYDDGYYRNGKVLKYVSNKIEVDIHDNRHELRKATGEEIEEHLIKQAEKRGYGRGVTVNSFIHNKPLECLRDKSEIKYLKEYDKLHYGTHGNNCVVIYHKGEWAKMVNTITKAEA